MIMCDILLHHSLPFLPHINSERGTGRGGGRIRVQTLRNRRTRCRWIGSHFHDSIDFYGVAFSAIFNRVTRMGLHIFEISGVRKLLQVRIHLGGRFMVKKFTIF